MKRIEITKAILSIAGVVAALYCVIFAIPLGSLGWSQISLYNIWPLLFELSFLGSAISSFVLSFSLEKFDLRKSRRKLLLFSIPMYASSLSYIYLIIYPDFFFSHILITIYGLSMNTLSIIFVTTLTER